MKIRYVVFAPVVAMATATYAQNYNNSIGMDVTPRAQVERNREIEKREAEARRIAEAQAEEARKRALELERARIQAESARIQAQAEIEAAKNRKPDVCLNCVYPW